MIKKKRWTLPIAAQLIFHTLELLNYPSSFIIVDPVLLFIYFSHFDLLQHVEEDEDRDGGVECAKRVPEWTIYLVNKKKMQAFRQLSFLGICFCILILSVFYGFGKIENIQYISIVVTAVVLFFSSFLLWPILPSSWNDRGAKITFNISAPWKIVKEDNQTNPHIRVSTRYP